MNDVKTTGSISPKDFAALGVGQLAYVRETIIDGQPAFAIFAANGRPLGAVASEAAALAAMQQHDLEPVSLH